MPLSESPLNIPNFILQCCIRSSKQGILCRRTGRPTGLGLRRKFSTNSGIPTIGTWRLPQLCHHRLRSQHWYIYNIFGVSVIHCFAQGTDNGADNEDIFADLDRRVNVVATTEPNAYINADPDYSGACVDPIKFWSDKCGDRFARLALDFVSAPGNVLYSV